jgi:hypothetical protein
MSDFKTGPDLHVHVWDKENESDDPPMLDIDVEQIDEYDEYYQYGFMFEGRWFELRILKPESPDA